MYSPAFTVSVFEPAAPAALGRDGKRRRNGEDECGQDRPEPGDAAASRVVAHEVLPVIEPDRCVVIVPRATPLAQLAGTPRDGVVTHLPRGGQSRARHADLVRG